MPHAIPHDEAPRARAARGAHAPERRCAVTRRKQAQAGMVRFVAAPDGSVVADIDGALPGRGLWVGAERALVERALRKGILGRVGRTPPDIAGQIERRLARRCCDLLGLARRAGQVASGYEAVHAALAGARAAVLVEARDGAPAQRARLERLGRAAVPGLELVTTLDRAELGAALGREEAVHVAVDAGRLAERLVREARRLAGFRRETAEAAEETRTT